jgi:Protein of unknown function (DUF3761)/Bacterial SH3 domain
MVTTNRIAALFTLLLVSVFALPADAHRSGCHRWHSCPSDTGSYTMAGRLPAPVTPAVQPAVRPPTLAAATVQATTTSNANLRQAPSTSSAALLVIPEGTRLSAGSCTTWCPVTYGQQRGYVARRLLSFGAAAPQSPVSLPSMRDTYTNVDGQQIQRPTFSETAPAGASAKCRDGSYSFSTHRQGTCSRHGGVDAWM